MRSLKSKQGYNIYIKEFIPQKTEKIIIACHGFGGDKTSSAIELLAQKLNKHNIMVIAFDFPAHGESNIQGDFFTVENCINDLIMVEEYLKNKYQNIPIGIFATSFGAYIALLKINKFSNKYFKIVLRAPAICMGEIFKNAILKEKLLEFKKNGYVILGYEKKIKITYQYYEELIENNLFKIYNKNEKLLIIQGTKDTMAPINDSINFIQQINTKGEIFKIVGADHRMKEGNQLDIAIDKAVNYILN